MYIVTAPPYFTGIVVSFLLCTHVRVQRKGMTHSRQGSLPEAKQEPATMPLRLGVT